VISISLTRIYMNILLMFLAFETCENTSKYIKKL